jgi:hypothetical protein
VGWGATGAGSPTDRSILRTLDNDSLLELFSSSTVGAVRLPIWLRQSAAWIRTVVPPSPTGER